MSGLGWEQVRAWRVARHGLGERAPASELLAVASRLCGVHAQLMGSAELTLWARLEALDPGAVAAALWEDRTLVKTWAMRGTLHLLPAGELGLWLAGPRHLRPLPQARVDPRLRHLRGGAAGADRRGRRGARRRAADPRRARRRRRGAHGRRGAAGEARPGVRRLPQARRVPRPAVLRARRRAEGPLHAPGRLARPRDRAPGRRTRRCARSPAATSPSTARRRARTSGAGGRPPRPRPASCCARSRTRTRSSVDGEPHVDARGRRRGGGRAAGAAAGVRLLPAFDQYVDRRHQAGRALPRRRASATGSTARRAGSRPCCWSTA